MKILLVIATLVLSTNAVFAQDYTPPSRDLWVQMVQALQNISMPAAAHQQVGQILINVQQQAKESANAKQVPKAGANDAGGSPQSEVRKEDGNPAEGGEGVRARRSGKTKGQ